MSIEKLITTITNMKPGRFINTSDAMLTYRLTYKEVEEIFITMDKDENRGDFIEGVSEQSSMFVAK